MKKSNFTKFLILWGGELISSIGGGLTSFGLGVYIFQMTGSAASMAAVTLLGFLPTLLLSVPAGVLADRYDRRVLMMVGDGCSALGIIYILICMMNGGAGLAQICIGVTISAVFSALLEPSFRSTITDILTKEEYSKASGLVSLAGSARYLFSPVIAGFLLAVSDVKLLLVIDIFTFFLTVAGAAAVRRGLGTKEPDEKEPFFKSLKGGWEIISRRRGVMILVGISSVITLFMGIFQILAEPFILSSSDAKTLGIAETVCALGMLASGLVLGIRGLKGHYVLTLSLSLALAGLFMLGFPAFGSIITVCVFGFLFFATLPFANNCLDYLIRTNIPAGAQGRAWGMIGFISQLGYVVAYSVSGSAADALGRLSGKGVGQGASMFIMAAGICLAVTAVTAMLPKSVRELETDPAAQAVSQCQ
ncbi:MAG: MFS transporter [Lachnospiraceae bacterium]|nr:MFS transporter [Lachnospiraceae bacterium]